MMVYVINQNENLSCKEKRCPSKITALDHHGPFKWTTESYNNVYAFVVNGLDIALDSFDSGTATYDYIPSTI